MSYLFETEHAERISDDIRRSLVMPIAPAKALCFLDTFTASVR